MADKRDPDLENDEIGNEDEEVVASADEDDEDFEDVDEVEGTDEGEEEE